MMARTHLAFGLILFWLFAFFDIVAGFREIIIAAALLFFAVLLPDIDTSTSKVGRRFKIIGWLSKHRGWFHSIFAAVLFTILISLFLDKKFALIFLAGYGSHLLLDSISAEGTRLFYPSKLRTRGKIRVGSAAEGVVSILLFVLGAVMVYRLFW